MSISTSQVIAVLNERWEQLKFYKQTRRIINLAKVSQTISMTSNYGRQVVNEQNI